MKDYLLTHSRALSKKYTGKYLAVVKNKLVAVGNSHMEVFEKAKKLFPSAEVSISYIPTDEEMVTLL